MTEIELVIRDICRRELRKKEISITDDIRTIKGHRFAAINIVAEVSIYYSCIKLDLVLLAQIFTVKKMAAYVQSQILISKEIKGNTFYGIVPMASRGF